MIKNIVFDLGEVVVDHCQNQVIDSMKFNQETTEVIKSIFKSDFWQRLDKGEYSLKKLIKLLCKKHPIYSSEIKSVLNTKTDKMFCFKPDSVELLSNLKHKGYRLYILSNTFKEAFKYVKSNKSFYSLVDGEILSYRVKTLKPDKEIYNILLQKYKLIPKETIFIDDKKENIEAANSINIKGILFTNIEEVSQNIYKEINSDIK